MGFPRQEYWSGLPFPSSIKKLLLLFFGSAGSSLLCAFFVQFWQVRTILRPGARDSHCARWLLLVPSKAPGHMGSVAEARALEHRLNSCGTRV